MTRQELEQLIATGDRNQVKEAVGQFIDGVADFHALTEKTRATQKAFFASKKVANVIEANRQLLASKELEKDLDKSIKEWSAILSTPAEGVQGSLFPGQ